MDPNFMVVVIAMIFASLFVVDRVTGIFKERSRNEEQTKQRLAEVAQIKDMTDSAVDLLRALHGGAAGEALRKVPVTIDMPEERTNGGSAARYPSSTPAPAGFAGHRAAAAEGR